MNTTAYQLPSKEVLADKIHGCWIGKNIGGTLGGPLEGKRDIFDVKWYLSDPNGVPLPNDDLDLQLLWLTMAEYYGAEHLTSRHFGMMWMHGIIGPWGEYSNCRQNCHLGFFPPLSGACDNDGLNRSNGAWIRAEIWACLAAGKPDEAIRYAWLDSSCDHMTDGIYAEMFVAAMEAAAFCESDIRKLIEIGLSKIPDQCRLRESIELAISGYDAGKKWQDVRNEVVKLNEDMGWFQAPANVAFVVIGLLYGEGDFAKTVCTAVNCGDDTDCTAAT
ncbi:MAG: ADP-ribosylglycohydrolase family protein, partial [Lentisphaerae bacterium]|nr:ADP-ribosylglycohydrolase family protein [Lentisphaerota bacterium]